jgi:hypothetical protein
MYRALCVRQLSLKFHYTTALFALRGGSDELVAPFADVKTLRCNVCLYTADVFIKQVPWACGSIFTHIVLLNSGQEVVGRGSLASCGRCLNYTHRGSSNRAGGRKA